VKRVVAFLVLFAVVAAATACTSSTKYGDCIGVNDTQSQKLRYRTSTKNIVLAVIFLETIIVPIVVVADELSCPVGPRDAAQTGERL
jgi:hypothetical protein